MVRTRPAERESATVDLRLEEWGSVSSLIGAEESERERESAGYDLSARFLDRLRLEVGSDALRSANAAIAETEGAADSRRYMDVLEEVSGARLDELFAEWVFPDSFRPTLNARRQARDRLEEINRRAAEAGLSDEIPNAIREAIDAWQFDAALVGLGDAEQKLGEFEELKRTLDLLAGRAQAAGLELPSTIADLVQTWDFPSARLTFVDAVRAMEAYVDAGERLKDRRSLWEHFGLLGKNPGQDLERAEEAFAAGDFVAAADHANGARDAIDDASGTASRRLLILALVLGLIGAGIALGMWLSQGREGELI
jgi:hypothetical protein